MTFSVVVYRRSFPTMSAVVVGVPLRPLARPAPNQASDFLYHGLASATIVRQDDGHVPGSLENVQVGADAGKSAAMSNHAGFGSHPKAVSILRRFEPGLGFVNKLESPGETSLPALSASAN